MQARKSSSKPRLRWFDSHPGWTYFLHTKKKTPTRNGSWGWVEPSNWLKIQQNIYPNIIHVSSKHVCIVCIYIYIYVYTGWWCRPPEKYVIPVCEHQHAAPPGKNKKTLAEPRKMRRAVAHQTFLGLVRSAVDDLLGYILWLGQESYVFPQKS